MIQVIKLEELLDILQKEKVEYELLHHEPVFTMDDVKEVLCISKESMAKTLVFEDVKTNKYFIVVVLGNLRVNMHKLALVLQIPISRIKMVKPEKIIEILGSPLGGIPPFGHPNEIKIIFDNHILDKEYIYCGIGTNINSLKIKTQDLIRISKAEIYDVGGSP